MIHITKYLVSIKLHFVCFLIGFLLFMNIFYFYYFIPMAKRNRESPLKCLQDLVNVERFFKCLLHDFLRYNILLFQPSDIG